jgi:hypothetical protein
MVDRIRLMALQDLEEVIQIHLSSFQGFFLTFMGGRS